MKPPTVEILGVPITAIDLEGALDVIDDWIASGRHDYITVTGVHGVMEAQDDAEVKLVHQNAGMCVPDGTPLAWIGRLYGHKTMATIRGSDLMRKQLARSVDRGYTHFLYGGKPGVPELLQKRLTERMPGLKIVGGFSPPFRPMTGREEQELQELIAGLKPDIIWVGLSTPKQEKWMAAHLGRLETCIMIGVGAAFDFHAGLLREAPRFLHNTSLEWVFRLIMEPRRLWRRYLRNNPRFIFKVLKQFFKRPMKTPGRPGGRS